MKFVCELQVLVKLFQKLAQWRARSPPRRQQAVKSLFRRFSFVNFSLCACGVKEKSGYEG